MKKAIKAAMLSAFVFPGFGHLLLKRYLQGVVFIGTTFSALYLIISEVIERAQQIADKIISGEVQFDIVVITDLISRQSTGTEAQLLNIAGVVLLVIWLVSIVDSYRIGYLQDKDT